MEWTPGLCHNPLEIVTIKKRSSSLKLEVEWINLWSYNVRYNQTGTAQNRGPTLALPSHPIRSSKEDSRYGNISLQKIGDLASTSVRTLNLRGFKGV